MQDIKLLDALACDRVFALYFTGYKDRKPRFDRELRRIGIGADQVQSIWQYPCPYDIWEMGHLPHTQYLPHQRGSGIWSASKAHYASIATAYDLGCRRILIMEDDCRFAKNLTAVRRALDQLPADWDVLMLDHFPIRGVVKQVNDSWTKGIAAGSTACYAMNRKAMERFLRMYESAVKGNFRRPILRSCDDWTNTQYLGNDINFYCATPNLAVQCTMPGPSNCGRLHCEAKYRAMHVDLHDYMEY